MRGVPVAAHRPVITATPCTDTGTGSSRTYTVASTAGSLLVFGVSTGTDVTSITDSAGNTWAIAKNGGGGANEPTYIWRTTNASPGAVTSITVNSSTAAAVSGVFLEIANADTTAATQATAAANTGAGSTALSSGASGAPANAGCIAVGCSGWDSTAGARTVSAVAFTEGAGTDTLVDSIIGGTTHVQTLVSYRVLTGGGAQTYSGTLSAATAVPAATCVALFKAA